MIATEKAFVSVNATTEVDLMGQCASETMAGRDWSSSGGQADFARGAMYFAGGTRRRRPRRWSYPLRPLVRDASPLQRQNPQTPPRDASRTYDEPAFAFPGSPGRKEQTANTLRGGVDGVGNAFGVAVNQHAPARLG